MAESIKEKSKYDFIYIGTGPILILDALNETLKGKNVLMIDSSNEIGGAWKLIDLFGLEKLENAVHYLMPNKFGYKFLNEYLGIELTKSKNKFYANKVFSIPILLKTSSFKGKFVHNIFREMQMKGFSFANFLKNLFRVDSTSTAKYPKNGSREILQKLHVLLENINIQMILKTPITGIEVIEKNKITNIITSKGVFSTNQLIISHGFVPPNKMYINYEKIKLDEKIYPRPSLHIIYKKKDSFSISKLSKFSQIIFTNDPCIKYVHELTQYIDRDYEQKDTYALVVALKHHLRNEQNTYNKVVSILEDYKIIPNKDNLDDISFYWQDILLPLLSTDDLLLLQNKSKGLIRAMITEELNSCIGFHQERWDSLKKYLSKTNL